MEKGGAEDHINLAFRVGELEKKLKDVHVSEGYFHLGNSDEDHVSIKYIGLGQGLTTYQKRR